MTFLHGAMLWGSALASIPVIIWLLNRQRYKRIEWAAMEFLLAALKKNHRRLQIENILLLIIRTLIILFIVLGLARPILEAVPFFRPKKSIIIVIDNSFSMAYKEANRTLLDNAKVKAQEIIKNTFYRGDNVSIILMSSHPRSIFAKPSYNIDTIKSEIDRIGLSDYATNLSETLQVVLKTLDKKEMQASRVVHIISDCQRNGWLPKEEVKKEDKKSLFEKQIAVLKKKDVKVYIYDVGAELPLNLAVIDLSTRDKIVGRGLTTTFSAEVTNFGTRDEKDLVFLFYVDDMATPKETRMIVLKAGEKKKETFNYEFTESGGHSVKVVLQSDRLAVDNERFLALDVKKSIDILLVEGREAMPSLHPDEREAFFISKAFRPGESEEVKASTIFNPSDPLDEQGLITEKIGRYTIVVLCNILNVDKYLSSKLEKYARDGGGLLIFLGDNVSPAYNQFLYKNGDGILPVEIDKLAGAKDISNPDIFTKFLQEDFSHPAIKFFKGYKSLLSASKFYRWYRTIQNIEDKNVTIIARFAKDRDIAIAEKSIGRGKVILFTTACDADWGTMPATICYTCLMQEIGKYLAASKMAYINIMVGEELTKIIGPEEYTKLIDVESGLRQAVIVLPDNTEGYADITGMKEQEGRFLFSFRKTEARGIYKIKPPKLKEEYEELVKGEEFFATNVATSESDLERVSKDEIEKLFKGVLAGYWRRDEEGIKRQDKDIGKHSEYWKYLIWIVLILLALETFLAQHFGDFERRAKSRREKKKT